MTDNNPFTGRAQKVALQAISDWLDTEPAATTEDLEWEAMHALFLEFGGKEEIPALECTWINGAVEAMRFARRGQS